MIDNELQVRLLHAAKTQDQWKAVTSYPKKGEVCLEAINTSGATAFKIKIGDGTRPYCRNTGTTESPVWDFTSNEVLPYFGTVVTASGTPQVFSLYKYPDDYSVISLRGKTVARIYQLTLSATENAGETTIALGINQNYYKEIRPGNNITFTGNEETVPSSTILEISANMDFSSLDVGDIALAEIHKADPEDTSDADAIRVYKINEVNGKIYKSSNFVDIKVSSPLTLNTTAGIGIQDGTTSQKGAVQLLDTYTIGDSGNAEDNTKATTNKAITAAISSLDGQATTLDDTTSSLDIINTVTETDGIVSSTKKTLLADNKINLVVPTGEDTNAGKIIINHDTVASPTTTQGTQDIPSSYTEGEKETLVITDVTTDGYGHITSYKSEASTNLIAADIKAPVTKQDNSTWNYRETGGDISIGEDTARIPSLKGNTVVWNQIVDTSTSSVTLIFAHKYYTVIGETKSIQTGAGSAISVTGSIDMIFDLTKMFGAGNEPSTVGEFEKLFPNSYYPYCEGRLVNLGGYGVKWNQMVQNGDFSDGTTGWVGNSSTISVSNNTITSTTTNTGSTIYPGIQQTFLVSPIIGHKYFINYNVKLSSERPTFIAFGGYDAYNLGTVGTTSFTKKSVILSARTARNYFVLFAVSSTSGEILSLYYKNIQIIDLTEMFGPGSEPTLEEFEAMFPKDYYEYNTGTEMNIFDAIGDKKLGLESTGLNQYNDGQASVLKGEEYYVGGTYTSLAYSDGTAITVTNNKFTADRNGVITVTGGGTDTIINISCEKDGAYEPYKKDTLDLDWIREIEYTPDGSSTPEKLFPYGLLSAGSVHDEVTETKAIKRVGVRDYQSGDENDSTVITDGNKTHYALSTSTEIHLAETHRMSYAVDDHGTEQQLPINASSVINAPFVGTFEYYSNFKDAIRDAIRDLFDKVNNQKNPVKGIDDTPQTNGKLAVYDSDHTVESSNYSVLPSGGNPFEGSTTGILLPTAEQIITYVNSVVASTLTYKGTVSTWEGLPTSGQSNGDLWIASAVITHDGNTYYPGTFFIWNSGDSPAHWDIVASSTTVSDKNPYLWIEDPEDPTSIISGGTQYEVGAINGTSIHVRVPELPDIAGKQASGTVLVGNGTGANDNTASWRRLKLDETINNNNTSIGDLTTGLLERYDNGTLDTHSYQWRLADTSAITLINPTNSSATSGKVLVGNYNASSETHTTPPSWRNLKLDELSYDGTNLIPNLGTGLLKRTGNDSWVLTEESLVWKTTSGTTNFNAVSSDGTSLTNKIHNSDVTTIELGSHTESSNNIIDGFRVNIPLLTSNNATVGKVLKGTKTTGVTTLPTWGYLSIEELSEVSGTTEGTHGYLKRTATNSGTAQDPNWTYTWEFDPYGGGSVMPYKSNSSGTGDVATSSKTTAEINLLPTAGEKILARTALREQIGTNSYVYHKISVGALENDSNIVLILNGNFS